MSNFNFWFVLAPLALVVVALAGVFSVIQVACKVFPRWDDRHAAHMASIAATAAIGTLVLRESYRGLLQLGLNCLTRSDSPFWGGLMAGGFFLGAMGAYYFLCLVTYSAGRIVRERYARASASHYRQYCASVGGRGVFCPFMDSDEVSCSMIRSALVRKQVPVTQTDSEGFAITSFLPADVSYRH